MGQFSTALGSASYAEKVRRGRFDPISLVTAAASSKLLTSYVVYERAGRWHLAGNPLGEVRVGRNWIRSTLGGGITASWSGNPWPQVRAALKMTPLAGWRAYGWACFELSEPGTAAPDDLLAYVMVPTIELEITTDSLHIRATDSDLGATLAEIATDAPIGDPDPVLTDGLDQHYLDGVGGAIRQIRDGSLHKVILSRSVDVPFEVDMPATYAVGRRANTPARSFLLDLGGWQATGFSPEIVLEADASGLAATQPLAGTRVRTGHSWIDDPLRAELLIEPKEVFEHAISVKEAFDELAGVGRPGATRVSEFLEIKNRGSVQHLGSRIETLLAAPHASWDAFAAVFPAITASGIPKAMACQTIRGLEPTPRGLYGGAVLIADGGGLLDAALVLRAVYQRDGRAWLRAGAGVVTASTPAREHEETCEKFNSIAPYLVPRRR